MKDSAYINVNYITAKDLYNELVIAWELVKAELLTHGSITRKNALSRFDISPPLAEVSFRSIIYDKAESDFLINYYLPLLKGKLLNGKKHLQITAIKKESYYNEIDRFIILVVISKSKEKLLFEYLERVTQQFNLPFPTDVLETYFK